MMKNDRRFQFFCLVIVFLLLLLSTSHRSIRSTILSSLRRSKSVIKSKNTSLYLTIDVLNHLENKQWFDPNELSGEYEEIPDLYPRQKSQFSYRLNEIFFVLTSNTERILDTIHEIKFWSQQRSIRCLITFEERDLRQNPQIRQWLKDQGVRCQILLSTIKRFEERYFHLIVQSWNLIEKQSLKTQWLALGDDDTLWFIKNLLYLLKEYNASQLIYLGNISDRLESIERHGNHFAYGGGGILISRPLHRRLAQSWNECHETYSVLYGGDEMVGKCIGEVHKTNLTRNMHFHQFDHEGDLRGYLQSGINGLVSFHHLFSSWKPYPSEHVHNSSALMSLLTSAYDQYETKYLKRYRKYNWKTKQTYLFTLGYSFTIIDQILTAEDFQKIERTWCCTGMTTRSFRPNFFHQMQWFFLNVTKTNESLRSTHRTYLPRWLPLPSLMQIQSK